MAQYTCSNADCPTAGETFTLTSTGQTYCPNCYENTLVPFVPPRQLIYRLENVPGSNVMTTPNTTQENDVRALIGRFFLTRQSADEANTTTDNIVQLGTDRRKRIDRQGPVRSGIATTHAKFAVQLGGPIYAGIHMPVDTDFPLQTVKDAFIRSMQNHVYVRIVPEWV
jgi:hypothetical protein